MNAKIEKKGCLWKLRLTKVRIHIKLHKEIIPLLRLLKHDLLVNFWKFSGGAEKTRGRGKKIHFVYFTCKNHFDYLFASLKSLEKLKLPYLGRIFLYIDKKDPFTQKQIKQIANLNLKTEVKKTKHPMAQRGVNLIINELEAFKKIFAKMGSEDYLAKADSDILFISEQIFKKVFVLKKNLIGQQHTNSNSGFNFTQGGCYFLSHKIIPKIINSPLFYIIKEVSKKDHYMDFFCVGEDTTIYSIIEKNTKKIQFEDFYLPIEKINNITKKEREKYSIIHFESWRINRKKMLETAKKLGL